MAARFGPFTFDEGARRLCRGPQALHLSPKAFDLLALLMRRRPEAIAKAELHKQLWPDTFVSDISLAVLVAEIRAVLGEDARHPQFVRTVHRFGYAFSGTVREVDETRPAAPGPASCWLAWGTQRAPLVPGNNLVGRDPTADVRVDAVGVSRLHAMIVVSDEEVTLEDLSSKNGTYIDDSRVTSPVPLVDGVEMRLGPVVVQFRRIVDVTPTQTLGTSLGSESHG